MTQQPIPPLTGFFKDAKDPRAERNKAYPLVEAIVITLPAAMAFAEGREGIERYGKAKEGRLKSGAAAACFMAWVRAVKRGIGREAADLQPDAIDGKTARGSFNTPRGRYGYVGFRAVSRPPGPGDIRAAFEWP
jgi:hypothetical protein